MLDKIELKDKILTEAHNTRYLIHPGGTKMYRDLKQYFWCDNMKRNNCGVCESVFNLSESQG